MAVIKPFRALRPARDKAEQVSCAPYDVAYEREVREFIANRPHSFLRVTRAEAEFPAGANLPAGEIFERAKQNLERFIDEEILTREAESCVYVYRLATGARSQTGVVACCSLDEYEAGAIKKHEKTRPDKVADRAGHMLALRAQTGLIFLAFRNSDTIKNLISEATQNEPIYDFYCAEGVEQTVWRVASTDNFIDAFADVPALYVADGHHRIESALQTRNALRARNPNHTGAEDYNFVVAGLFPVEDLRILAYNRVVTNLNGLSEAEFFARLEANFHVVETSEKEPRNRREFCMYWSGKWYNLRFNVEFVQEPNAVERLDVSILQNYVLAPVLGIANVQTDERIGFIGGKRGTAELEKLVDAGAAAVAFSMFPTTMDELFAVSDIGEIMPPKSTWFEPKLRDGLLINLLED